MPRCSNTACWLAPLLLLTGLTLCLTTLVGVYPGVGGGLALWAVQVLWLARPEWAAPMKGGDGDGTDGPQAAGARPGVQPRLGMRLLFDLVGYGARWVLLFGLPGADPTLYLADWFPQGRLVFYGRVYYLGQAALLTAAAFWLWNRSRPGGRR